MLSFTACPDSSGKSRLSADKAGFAGKNLIAILFFFLLISQMILPQWYQQNSGTTNSLLAVTFLDKDNGWVVGQWGIILRTTDGGTTWSQQTSGTTRHLPGVSFPDLNNGWAVGYGTILHTTNGGITWTQQSLGTTEDLYGVWFYDAICGTVVGGGDYGFGRIFNTTNGGITWTTHSKYAAFRFYGVSYSDIDHGYVVGEDTSWFSGGPFGVIYRTINGGASWVRVANSISLEYMNDISTVDENNATAVGGSNTILRTTDGGINWIQQNSGIMNLGPRGVSFINASTGTVVGHSGRIIKTKNGGISWIQQTSGTNNPLWGISFVDQNHGWAVGEYGTIVHTTNGGEPIKVLYPNGGEYWVNGTSQAIAWTSENMENVRLELSTDNGTNWFIIVDSTASNGLYIWTVNVPSHSTECLIKISDLSYPDYYDESDSIFSIDIMQSVELLTDKGIPEEFMLFQNFPNPFNPTTTIQFAVPTSCFVGLKLYDILGKEVSTLISENKNGGYYSFEFNASNLPSGVYLYRINAGEYVATKKMVLLR